MKTTRIQLTGTLIVALGLTACSSGSLRDTLPDRRPDYRQSSVGRNIEVPPDLSGTSLNDQLSVSDFNPAAVASYSDYNDARIQRDDRGFIEVLPALYGVQVYEPAGQLPYMIIDTDASTAWQVVRKYWAYNGIRLKVDDPSIGVMETDWLENVGDMPSTGISGFLNNVLGFASDSDERDRYRLRFSRLSPSQTQVALIYSKSEQVAEYDFPTQTTDPSGFTWQLSDTNNPELQLEMTRRIAVFASNELQRSSGLVAATENESAPALSTGFAQITTLPDGQPALIMPGNYAQSWRVLGIGLDKASFAILGDDYQNGTYRVRYQPQSDLKTRSYFSSLWGSDDEPASQRPEYLVRLSDQGAQSIAVVQNGDGSPANAAQAEAVFQSVQAVL